DFLVRDIETRRDLHDAQLGQAWNRERLIGHQRDHHTGSFGRAKQNVLDHFRTSVRIDPDAGGSHAFTSNAHRNRSVPFFPVRGPTRIRSLAWTRGEPRLALCTGRTTTRPTLTLRTRR